MDKTNTLLDGGNLEYRLALIPVQFEFAIFAINEPLKVKRLKPLVKHSFTEGWYNLVRRIAVVSKRVKRILNSGYFQRVKSVVLAMETIWPHSVKCRQHWCYCSGFELYK